MFRKVEVPVFGIIENMSYFLCPHCGERTNIFSADGGVDEAKRMETDLLGQIPLDTEIRETSDSGEPIVATKPESKHAKAYIEIAKIISAKVAQALVKKSESTPNIVMQ
jgi:ATP-binding protein involved in chromosome partitioning